MTGRGSETLDNVSSRVRKGHGAIILVLPGGLKVTRKHGHIKGKAPVGSGAGGGPVRGLTHKSRRAMLARFMAVDWAASPVWFITLTYYRDWGKWGKWKADLARFRKRLCRAWSVRGGVWRLETTERRTGPDRGTLAPHFHLAVFWADPPDLGEFSSWVATAWNDVVGGDAAHLEHGSHVQEAANVRGSEHGKLISYLGKGFASTQPSPVPTGRLWGVWGSLPTARIATLDLPPAAYSELTRRLRERGEEVGSWYLASLSPRWRGFTVWGDGQLLADELLDGLGEIIE